MKKPLPYLIFALCAICFRLSAQQQVTVMSRCGGTETVTIPTIIDNDGDGMDDVLEQKLLERFMPTFIQFDNESCPGPATDGTGDTNLVVARIYPLPQQYAISTNLDSVVVHPTPLVPVAGLTLNLIWYKPLIMVNAALLYGKDCGLLGHTSDVEGFTYSIKYIGADSLAGWMYDTVMANWMGGTIQTVSHAGTPCQHKETFPYKSLQFPNGKDTIYASPDKHGNYLTTGGCGSSFICNPGCGGTPSTKKVKAVNIGEPNASLVADLGAYYSGYPNEDPWSTFNFLDAQDGDAGTIRAKMIKEQNSDFIQGEKITSASQICELYNGCYGPFAVSVSDYTCYATAYDFNGRTLSAPGTYRDTLSNMYGCDSAITLQLSVLPQLVTPVSQILCAGESYTFDNTILTISGNYSDTLTSVSGCDSIVNLDLVVRALSGNTINASVCEGNSYSFHGTELSLSGSYTDTLQNTFGCDSVVSLNLQVDTIPVVSWNLNTDTVQQGSYAILLAGVQPTGGTFTGEGVYGNIFFPDSATAGTHTITYVFTDSRGCTDSTSQLITFLTTGINEPFTNDIILFPNPVKDVLNISGLPERTTVSILDISGRALQAEVQYSKGKATINTRELSNGAYLLRLEVNGLTTYRKFMVR